jgi:hypothetical protein
MGFMPYLTLLANRSALSARGQTPESVPKAALVTPDRQAWRKWMAPGAALESGVVAMSKTRVTTNAGRNVRKGPPLEAGMTNKAPEHTTKRCSKKGRASLRRGTFARDDRFEHLSSKIFD